LEVPEGLERMARDIPAFQMLESDAMHFMGAIFGSAFMPPLRHAQEDLASFTPFLTLKLAALLRSKMSDAHSFRLQIRYFAGVGNKDEGTLSSNEEDMVVVEQLTKFFKSLFEQPENLPIEKCMKYAQSLYITARTEREGKQGFQETVIACLNFAYMEDKGFYVDWLSTSDEDITKKKYGDRFAVEASGSWRRRGIALFLLKTVWVAVSNKSGHSCHIVLQARTASSEPGHLFYRHVGFEERGRLDMVSELNMKVFEGFAQFVDNPVDAVTDYIHFIWDHDEKSDLSVFRNSSGVFSKLTASAAEQRPKYPELDIKLQSTTDTFVFPFLITREHVMLLSSGLDFYFLPFRVDVQMNDFIQASQSHASSQFTEVDIRTRERFMGKKLFERVGVNAKEKPPDIWLNDQNVDFFARW
jgi:hypothetical protein